jgi:hypothetical protein
MLKQVQCEFCGAEWKPERDYRLVTGWERYNRQVGGTNALRCREPQERFACMFCVENLAKGRSPGQMSFS